MNEVRQEFRQRRRVKHARCAQAKGSKKTLLLAAGCKHSSMILGFS